MKSSKNTPAPKRGRPKTTNREHVLEMAMRAYWHEDPVDVSVNSICRIAETSKPALYREFGGEDGLTLATLDHYAEKVLGDLFSILTSGRALQPTLDALIAFACDDPRMETGCLFYKMRNGKHRLGPQTRARVDEIDAGAQAAYATLLRSAQDESDWPDGPALEIRARYLSEQVGLAITQRASGEDRERIRASLTLALSAILK